MSTKSLLLTFGLVALIAQTFIPQSRIEAAWDKAITNWNAPKPQFAGSTVLIDSKHSEGSGVHIGKDYIITAAHVLTAGADVNDINITTDTGQKAKAELLWMNENYDIALLRSKVSGFTRYSRLTCRDPQVDERIRWKGNPLSSRFVTIDGTVARGVSRDGSRDTFMIAGPVIPGMSGGPVLDQRGSVVGITVMVMTPTLGKGKKDVHTKTIAALGWAVPSSAICTLMARK